MQEVQSYDTIRFEIIPAISGIILTLYHLENVNKKSSLVGVPRRQIYVLRDGEHENIHNEIGKIVFSEMLHKD